MEEIARFILDSRGLTTEFKKIRHKIDSIAKGVFPKSALLNERRVLRDVGRNIQINELKRKNLSDIFFANIQRIKESMRVLEEFSKLKNAASALGFKRIRYGIYELEKKVAKKIAGLRDYR